MADFIEAVCRLQKGPKAGQLIQLDPFQREILEDLFEIGADRRLRYRVALIGEPRKNSKSVLGSGLALDGLIASGEQGAEVYSAAGDKLQAKIVFNEAAKMVKDDPDLDALCKVYKDVIEVPTTGSIYRALSAEAFTKEGLNPSRVVFDEVHVQSSSELWDVLNLGSGTRVEPLVIGITTAGAMYNNAGQVSLCYRLYEHGIKVITGEVDDPYFYFRWYEPADPNCDHRDPAVWRECNPGIGAGFLFEDDFHSTVARTPEPEFRTKRLNQWVAGMSTWLPYGAWDGCQEDRTFPDGADAVLAFDGSFNGDSTALVVVFIDEKPHVEVVECWERPPDAGEDWRVPIADVEDAIRAACRRWQVRELVCDPYRWSRTYQVLEAEGLPVVEFPQTPSRMGPATARMYEAIVDGLVTHSSDPRLARHMANAQLKTDARGSRLTKDAKESARKIDLAVAAVMGLDRAAQAQEDEGHQIWL